jgi:hypothetical protein
MQGRGNVRFPCTPSPKPTSTTNKNRRAARTGKKLGCGNDARWNPWKSPTPTFPPLPPHLEIPQQTRDSHIPTATTTTGYRGLDQHQTKFHTNNKTKVVYTDHLTHPSPPGLDYRTVPNSDPTPAVTAIARAPQNVTRKAPTITPAPPARAAKPPRSARNINELPATSGITLAGETKVATKRGMTAPTAKLQADANAA